MKCLITADLQLSDHPRDAYRWLLFDRLAQLIEERAIEMLLILGDLTEQKEGHDSWFVNQVASRLQQLTRLNCSLMLLRGNHDFIDPRHPFFAWLGLIPKIGWINDVTTLRLANRECLFLPYTSDYAHDWLDLPETVDYVFAHNTFAGAAAESGFPLQGIPVAALPRARRVIAGDVHRPQQIGPVIYVGAPYTVDFGDAFLPRVLQLDFHSDKLIALELPGPQKQLISASLAALRNIAPKPGDILKIRLRIRAEEAANWPALVQAVREWGAQAGVTVFSVEPEIPGSARPARPVVAPRRSDAEIIQAFAAARGLDQPTREMGEGLLAGFIGK